LARTVRTAYLVARGDTRVFGWPCRILTKLVRFRPSGMGAGGPGGAPAGRV